MRVHFVPAKSNLDDIVKALEGEELGKRKDSDGLGFRVSLSGGSWKTNVRLKEGD
jgi:hypothetical protein